jgi:hypothetical protein
MRNYRVALLSLLFVTISYCSLVFYWLDLIRPVNKQMARLDGPKSQAKKLFKHNYQVLEAEPNSWIFNKNIMQYSTIASLNQIQQYEVEAILMFKEDNLDLVTFLECYFHVNNTHFIKRLVQYKVNVIAKRLFQIIKVKCLVDKADYAASNNKLVVSMIDSRAFDKNITSTANSTNKKLLLAHRVKIIIASKAKSKVMNCVHMLRNIDESRLKKTLNWIEMNKAFGMDKIVFYTVEAENEPVRIIKNKYAKLVAFNHYKTKIEDVCAGLIKLGMAYCVEKYSYFFDVRFFNYHERVTTNACFMNARLTHEFFTNLDIDELIFPRSLPTDYHETIECKTPDCKQECAEPISARSKNDPKNNLYNYTQQLVHIHGPKVAYFQFSHYLLLNEFEYFFQQAAKALSGKLPALEYNNENTRLAYELNTQADFEYLKILIRMSNFTNCLNETFLAQKTSVLHYQWTYSLTTLLNNREGNKNLLIISYVLLFYL